MYDLVIVVRYDGEYANLILQDFVVIFYNAGKVSLFRDFLVRIFPHSD